MKTHLTAVVSFVLITACLPVAGADKSAVVARVNGTEITRTQLDAMTQEWLNNLARSGQGLSPERSNKAQEDVLNQLIGYQLLSEKSKGLKVENLDAKVKVQFEILRQKQPDPKKFAEELKAANLTEAKLRERIADDIRREALIDQEVRSKIKIGQDEVEKFYQQNPQYFARPAQVRISLVFVSVPPKADEKTRAQKRAIIDKARERVFAGEDFAKVASEVSEDQSKGSGGDVGFLSTDAPGRFSKEIQDAAFALKANEVSPVLATAAGFYILKQTDNRPASTATLEEERDNIVGFLTQQKVQDGLLAYIEDLKKGAKIEVLLK